MTQTATLLRNTALTAAIGLGLTAPALAQDDPAKTDAKTDAATEQAQTDTQTQADADQKVATVNGTEIVTGEVMRFVETLPDQMRRGQPPEMLISAAVQQLVMRELILEEARDADLAEDERVTRLVEQSSKDARDDAMVQVWLQDRFEDEITDQKVQEAYDTLSSNSDEELPPMTQLRPRIEQQLRQQAFADLRRDLQDEAEIVFYDASGNPLPQEGTDGTSE